MSTRLEDAIEDRTRNDSGAVRPLVTIPNLACKRCGAHTFDRIPRYGFWQESILPFFNLYPWRCVSCAKTLYRTARMARSTDRM
jgi:hypothetical protein